MKKISAFISDVVSKTSYASVLTLSVVIAGCGGGGGGGGGGGTTDPTPTPVSASPTPTSTPITTPTPSSEVTPTPTPSTEPTVSPSPTPTPELTAVALSGSVSSFPDTSGSGSTKMHRKYYGAGALKTVASQHQKLAPGEDGFTRDDMVPASALVSIFLLSDVNFEMPIATVPTDENGVYEVTVADVRDYLIAQELVDENASESEFVDAFRALGQLQVRALIVKEDDAGERKAIAIQSIADPNNLDDSGEPVPVVVDPIVHRVVKAVVDQIRDAISSLQLLGLSQSLVNTLADTVIAEVVDDITTVVAEAADSIIEIPEGQTIDDVIAQQEANFEVDVSDDELTQLESVIDGTAENREELIALLQDGVLDSDEVLDDEQSTLVSSLNSEQQGLIAGLGAALGDNVTDEVDDAIENAEDLAAIFNLAAGQTAEQALAAQIAEKARQLRVALRRLFLSMGLSVVVDENEDGDAGVVAVYLPVPAQLPNDILPGGTGLGERSIRIFKIGSGDLDSDSNYTDDPEAALGVPDSNGVPQAPLYFAPEFSSVAAALLPEGTTIDALQDTVDAAFSRISDPTATPTAADYTLIDRVRLFLELNARVQESSLVSSSVIDTLVENRDSEVRIKRLAAVIAEFFTWAKNGVNVTEDGFPIYTGRATALEGGADVIDSSELVRALSITLADEATDAAVQLTERVSFYAQFADDAVQKLIQQANFDAGPNFDVVEVLAEIYPEDVSAYRDLIIGTDLTPAAPDYSSARDLVARGLTSAVPSTLFGRTLNSESLINIRSALFFLNFLLNGEYLIDAEEGFFTEIEIAGTTRYIPNYNNTKYMQGSDAISVASVISALLDVTEIDNGDFHDAASSLLYSGLGALPELPEYKEQDLDDFEGAFGSRADVVNLSCTVERFDGADPAEGDTPLALSVFAVNYDMNTGSFFKGEALDVAVSSELVVGEGPVRRTYTISDLPSLDDNDEYGLDYVVRFEIPGYQNDLPELFFWVDGYIPDMVLCDAQFPLFIGPDQEFMAVPGLGLVSDQSRPDATGTSQLAEGVDISNFEEPGGLIYLTEEEEQNGYGTADFTFDSVEGGFAITAADDEVGFAPLFGEYVEGELLVTLVQGDLDQLSGINNLIGKSLRSTLESVIADDSSLSSTITLDADLDTFEFDQLYLMRDAGGKFWVIEVRFLDVYTNFDGATEGFTDIGIASINSLGIVGLPDAAFGDFPGSDTDETGLFYQSMLYGDWLILEPPEGYDGPTLLEAEQVSFGGRGDLYDALETASDGVIIRYASNHFEENITAVDDFDAAFGNPPDYGAIPVRVDAGREGITFVTFSFNKSSLAWVMDPAPEDAVGFAANLDHGDMLAVFSDTAEDPDSPVYLGRVVRYLPDDDPYANFEIAFEWIRFADIEDQGSDDPRAVVCFFEESEADCPSEHPQLYFSSAVDTQVGTVFDEDFDGVPALFDPNDSDPNVPGSGDFGSDPGFFEGLEISAFAESDGAGGVDQSFLVETFNLWPGEIQAVHIVSDIFATEEAQTVLTCTPPTFNNDQYVDFICSARDVAGGVTVNAQFQNGGSVGFTLMVPDETLATLTDRIDFEYEVTFRAPTDLDGEPLFCGTEACPARPSVEGFVSVSLPDDVVVLSDLDITIGTDEPQSLSEIASLDVTREFEITGDPIPGAFDYELTIYCPGSQPDEPWLPEENIFFHAPARDDAGRSIAPQFLVNVPWIGGRSCDFTVSAHLESDSGEFIGVSSITLSDVTTTGGGGFSFDNELDLVLNQQVCLEQSADGQFMPAVSDSCDVANILFTVTALNPNEDGDMATLTLGSGVTEARADGGRRDLTQGEIDDGSVVSFNVDISVPDDDIEPPTCGEVSTDIFSNTCHSGELSDVSTNFFSVTAGQLVIHPDAIEALPNIAFVDATGVSVDVPIDLSGFYYLMDTDFGEIIMEIQIDNYLQDGVSTSFAWFTLTAGVNEFESGDASNTFDVTSPGFIQINHDLGQPVDFDIRYVRGDEMRLAWYLPPPQSDLAGTHDIDANGTTDLNVSYTTDQWTFAFPGGEGGVSFLESFVDGESVQIEADSNGDYLVTVVESMGYAEFFGRLGDQDFRVFAGFDGAGEGFLESETYFGGGGGGGCFDCGFLAEVFISSGELQLSAEFDNEGYNFDGFGDEVLSIDVSDSIISLTLPEGSEAFFVSFSDTGEPIQSNSMAFSRNGEGFYFLSYVNENGENLDLNISDFDFDVQVIVLPGFGGDFGGPHDDEGGFSNPDVDGDGFLNEEDNCIIIPNVDQADSDNDGLGDVCDITVPDMTGVYLVDVLQQSGSQDYDDETLSCVPAEDEAILASIEMEGNQIFFQLVNEDRIDLVGIMDANGGFDMIDPDADGFQTDAGAYNQANGSFTFEFFDGESNDDGSIICNVNAIVTGTPPIEVDEAQAFELGVSWFEADDYDFGIEFEYGTIQLGSTETQFYWDDDLGEWVDVTEESTDSEFYLTDSGVVVVDDLYIIDGFSNGSNTAIVQPTIDGIATDIFSFSADLYGFEIAGVDVFGVLGEEFAIAAGEDAVFPTGAVAYLAELTNLSDSYSFWCDDDFAPDTLICRNVVPGSPDASGVVAPALSLSDVINSDADLDSGALSGHLWGGRGYDEGGEFSIDWFLVSSDGSENGTNLRAMGIKHYHSTGESVPLGEVDAVSVTIGSTTVIEFTIPEDMAAMGDLDDEERTPFVFVESEIESSAMVRQGRKQIAGESFDELMLNNVARDFIRDAFGPPLF